MIKYHFIISLLVKLFDLRENEWRIFAWALGVALTFFFYFSAHALRFLAGRTMFAEARSAVYFFIFVVETEDRLVRIFIALCIDQVSNCEVVYLALVMVHQAMLPMHNPL